VSRFLGSETVPLPPLAQGSISDTCVTYASPKSSQRSYFSMRVQRQVLEPVGGCVAVIENEGFREGFASRIAVVPRFGEEECKGAEKS
jgi:hypothetical protein